MQQMVEGHVAEGRAGGDLRGHLPLVARQARAAFPEVLHDMGAGVVREDNGRSLQGTLQGRDEDARRHGDALGHQPVHLCLGVQGHCLAVRGEGRIPEGLIAQNLLHGPLHLGPHLGAALGEALARGLELGLLLGLALPDVVQGLAVAHEHQGLWYRLCLTPGAHEPGEPHARRQLVQRRPQGQALRHGVRAHDPAAAQQLLGRGSSRRLRREQPPDEVPALRGDGGPGLGLEVQRPLVRLVQFRKRRAAEGERATEHEVDQYAQGPHVHSRRALAQQGLRGHVGGRATEAFFGIQLRGLEAHGAHNIHELQLLGRGTGETEVVRFQVPVHHAKGVDLPHGGQRLPHYLGHATLRDGVPGG
mmetsp:Transcript_63146/g.203566  ORF Transcript_63146/g.203566 Transcript_63146/m.203566 type:complete len:361 (-) Transcript_63146:420-1502(-)